MVSKGAVVSVLLQGHDLNGIVAQLANAWQHSHAEVQVAVDSGLLTGHANVALVDAQRPWPALSMKLKLRKKCAFVHSASLGILMQYV